VVESGTLAQMRHLTRSSIRATCQSDPSGLDQLTGVHGFQSKAEPDGFTCTFAVDNTQIGPVTAQLAGLGLEDLVCQPPSLEDVFLRHYEGTGR
jgi:ABC-2 type transport system ATP-binding protein